MVNFFTWALGRLAQLPPARAKHIEAQRGLRIPMPDGVELIADRYYPAGAADERLPVLLNRTPYGRMIEGFIGRLLVQRGYQVLVVGCRGTFGSLGAWEPLFNEEADGCALLKWLAVQPWFSGKLGTFGGSYHGFTQWAIFEKAPIPVAAASVMQMQSNFVDFAWPGGTFGLENVLFWLGGLENQELPLWKYVLRLRQIKKELPRAANALPVGSCDSALVGRRVAFFQDWLANSDRNAPYWTRIDYGREFARVPPMLLIAGWHDLFCKGQLDDFAKLRQAGRPVRLIVGPWRHGQPGAILTWIRETFQWLDAHFKGGPQPALPVRVFDVGSGQWRDLPDWPPAATRTRWYFDKDRRLTPTVPRVAGIDRYRFDPAAPTPVLGGMRLNGDDAGPRDNRAIEARSDVLTYTSEPLEHDVAIIGTIAAEVHARSSSEHTDFFIRVCDVQPDGRSINRADGVVRLTPQNTSKVADGTFFVRLELTPTANTFRRGHRIRVQVASGAHPLYSRNPGTGEPPATATRMQPADQHILHGPDHPSAIEIPVVT